MPRKTKDLDEKQISKKKAESKTVKSTKATKSPQENNNTKTKAKTKSKTSATKSTNATKSTKKTSSSKSESKIKVSSKTKKSPTKREKSVAKTIEKVTVLNYSPEYYDLPYRYNQTVVKILAQTPTNLFIYWDISDSDRQNLKNSYGEYFFEITKPVLIVTNITMNYSFEVDIDDFANSWYLHIEDSNCEYKVELGRRPIPINYSYIPNYNIEENGPIEPISHPYIYISSSNEIISPNDKILFNLKNKIYFRNVKTNEVIIRDIKEFPNIFNTNKFVSIYDLYSALFENEFLSDRFDLNNPSSGNPGSGSFLLKFK